MACVRYRYPWYRRQSKYSGSRCRTGKYCTAPFSAAPTDMCSCAPMARTCLAGRRTPIAIFLGPRLGAATIRTPTSSRDSQSRGAIFIIGAAPTATPRSLSKSRRSIRTVLLPSTGVETVKMERADTQIRGEMLTLLGAAHESRETRLFQMTQGAPALSGKRSVSTKVSDLATGSVRAVCGNASPQHRDESLIREDPYVDRRGRFFVRVEDQMSSSLTTRFTTTESRTNAREQLVLVERFGEIANHAALQSALARPFVGKGSDENGGNGLPGRDQPIMKLNSGHPRHLHICNHAGHFAPASGFQKILGAFERHCNIAQRPDEARQSLAHRLIVVDDRYDGFPWQFRSLIRTKNDAPHGFPPLH